MLADFGSIERADAADRFLRAWGLIVRKVGGYGLPQCLRITVGLEDEVTAVIEAMGAFVRQFDG